MPHEPEVIVDCHLLIVMTPMKVLKNYKKRKKRNNMSANARMEYVMKRTTVGGCLGSVYVTDMANVQK